MVSCRTLWRRPSLGASALLAATVLSSAQLHGSFVILVLCSLWLALRRHLQLDLRGLALGSLLAALPLVPTLSALFEGGAPPGGSAGSAGSPDLLLRLNSLEKGFLYWFRLSSLDLGRRFRQSLFCRQPGSELIPDPWLCRIVHLTEILALASIAVSLVAAAWWLRRSRRPDPASRGDSPERWYRTYSIAMFVAVLGSALLSPVLLQGWHVLIALPAACLPVAGWMLERWLTAGGWLRTGMVLFVFWRLPASLLLVGHPMYARPASPELPRHIVPQDLQVLLPQLDD
jgi:hypothetical protein